MEFNQELSFIEKELRKRADINHIPISGTFELTPLCNMDCRMCYVRMNKQEMELMGKKLHTPQEWISLAKKAVENGLMFLLLTGGEPFLYPGFPEVYKQLKKMGLVIMINTNGTVLNDEILHVLFENKPRRINISLYGSSNQVYEKLCRNPVGFSQVINCIEKLQHHQIDIRLNMALTPWNRDDFPNMLEVAKKYDVPVSIANYIFPAKRRNKDSIAADKYRFSPELAAEYSVEISKYYEKYDELVKSANDKLSLVKNAANPDKEQKPGFWCRGGTSSFWVTWDWMLTPCGMINTPSVPLDINKFEVAWKKLRDEVNKIWLSSECYNCSKRTVCQTCAASMVAETDSFCKKPEYQCRLTDSLLNAYRYITKEAENA